MLATEAGLAAERPLPWRLRPASVWSPIVISFPHVGMAWPAELGDPPAADFARNADYEVQSLYDEAAELGAVCIEAVYSRLLVDLNRAGDDISHAVVPDHPNPKPRRRPGLPPRAGDSEDMQPLRPGRGVVWAHALGNVPLLSRPLRYDEFRARIDRFHEPYHRAIEILLERRRRRFGYAILLDAHSMPCSVGVDLVVGTLASTSCAPRIERLALDALGDAPTGSSPRLRLRLNDPYHGGELVRRFGRPTDGIHALQLEVSRGLYMDERTMALWTSPGEASAHMPHASRIAAQKADASQPPTAKHAADFAELRRRVSCLVRALVEGLADAHRDASIAGTSAASIRATEADLGPAL